MKNLQKTAACSAFVMALAYVVGIALAFTLLDTSGIGGPLEVVRFHVENFAVYYAWITLIYIVSGAALVPLALGLFERLTAMDSDTRPLALIGTAFGLIWAALVLGSGLLHNTGLVETVTVYSESPDQAALFWRLIETVHAGIGASIEIPGGLWTILISLAALSCGLFPRGLNIFALVIGAAGVISIVPVLTDTVVPIYALGQIVWWIFMGIYLLRHPLEPSVSN